MGASTTTPRPRGTTASKAPITEKLLEGAIVEMASFYSWMVFHARPAQTNKGWRTPVAYDGKGYPDLTLVRDRVIFAEVKAHRGRLSPDQIRWREQIQKAGGEWYLWTPEEWESGAIQSILAPSGLRLV